MKDSPLISVAELAEMINSGGLVVLDCSWHMPAENRDPDREFFEGHIPEAQRFDFDKEVAARDTDLPHMLPNEQIFSDAARECGIHSDTTVVCYDRTGIFAAPRAWWMFKAMGHDRVAVLDGGFPAWEAAGQAVETGFPSTPETGDFEARRDGNWIRDSAQVKTALDHQDTVIIDARPGPRFFGEAAEPRPGLRSGSMPGARNLPFAELLIDGRMKPAAELDAMFNKLGSTKDKSIVATCGSGVTAAIVSLAAVFSGRDKIAVYDGSWAEWGEETRTDLPVVVKA